ncbi:uncharacterized protein LOC113205425 isoform X2 [Frankliniella occidentalis]|uniref:Uncharacterized protein LOC113205425 isoform X2 n=1 Tax=Frankliniella occidentalis TaxID=133901 RepID=A0A6J1S867_FRAOC|nr:uncharacterized protein LOC113205425 isoform X2 [Frankliniella occidentalis]
MAPSRQFANHPDPMDLWLETQGYYRKLTARDGSCLFRAIAEQVYYTQKFHPDVRKLCIDYLRNHLELFNEINIETEIETHLEHLQNPTCWGSLLEITALSHLFKIDIFIFKEVGVAAENAANTFYGKKVMLCFSLDRHYDSVYLKEFTKTAGYCQSLVYEMLYKNVFGMKDVDYAVDKMLHYKPLRHRGESGSSGSRKFFSYSCNSIQLQRKGIVVDAILDDVEVNVRDLLQKGVTPFPYKVAKSLDPNIFRNVEFDVWIDYRRGLRQGYFGTNNELQVGVKCLVKIEESTFVGHIQDMSPEKGPVVVFVEELGEKRTVPFENLELLPQEPLTLKQMPVSHSRNSSTMAHTNKCITNESSSGMFTSTGRRRTTSRSDQSSITDNSCDNLGRTCVYQESNMTSFTNYSVDSFNLNGAYHPYQFKPTMELGMSLPLQTHVLMSAQQHGSSQILIPVSPRPEDVPAHWLATNDMSSSADLSLDETAEVSHSTTGIETPVENIKNQMEIGALDDCVNYLPDLNMLNMQEPQINFNAPKSVLDDGADLPISDIQTLRFFYNLGNDVYRAQCSMQYGWGGYTQPCTVTSPSTPNPPGMCSGKCLCGPVCITTVPTIHRLLEPTTPPSSSRRKRKDSSTNMAGGNDIESSVTPPNSQPPTSTSGTAATPQPTVPPRFKSKGKTKKDAKALEGQPIVHQPTLLIPPAEETGMSESQNSTVNNDQNSPTLSIPYSPPFGYVYYPTSPVVPYSPVESDPYFSPLRLQFPTDYMPDTPQSPCFSLNGDLSVYGSSPQYPMMATSPHYLYPASPGIYVGSPPPGWSPLTPTTPQPQS